MYESNWIRLLVVSPYMGFFFNPNVSVQSNFSLHFGPLRVQLFSNVYIRFRVLVTRPRASIFNNEDRLRLDLIIMGSRRQLWIDLDACSAGSYHHLWN